ncbi:MAG: hypothetical protein EOM68_27620 [Spirochaetia bacterium]|nr:hypothetical protein [Spirochaetia bacterium]
MTSNRVAKSPNAATAKKKTKSSIKAYSPHPMSVPARTNPKPGPIPFSRPAQITIMYECLQSGARHSKLEKVLEERKKKGYGSGLIVKLKIFGRGGEYKQVLDAFTA